MAKHNKPGRPVRAGVKQKRARTLSRVTGRIKIRTAVSKREVTAPEQKERVDPSGLKWQMEEEIDVYSTAIRSFTYKSNSQQLVVQFQSGHVYVYFNVPPGVFLAFESAFSKGRYFVHNIRGQYSFRRIK